MKNRYLSTILLTIVLLLTMSQTVFCQSVSGWRLEAPRSSVQLIAVDQSGDVLRFTLRNVSRKTIIEYALGAPDGTAVGLDTFTTGAGAVEPDETTSATFSRPNFAGRNQLLHLKAIVYKDGTHSGSSRELARIESEMLGAALEMKRDAELLSANPDPGIGALKRVAQQMSSNGDAVTSVRGVVLPGIPRSYIERNLNHPSDYLRIGINRARQVILNNINETISSTSSMVTSARTPRTRAAVEQIQAHAGSEMAKRYRSISDSQIICLRAYIQGQRTY